MVRRDTIRAPRSGRRIVVEGRVQGVGFRPFVKRLADRHGVFGEVANTEKGVTIDLAPIDGSRFHGLLADLRRDAPSAARIDRLELADVTAPRDYSEFSIVESRDEGPVSTVLPPDLASCSECIRELHERNDRRYRYPFLNCSNCGPRFSIATRIPYDRTNTTMSVFRMCDRCQSEYSFVGDRRFHAEPTACAVCGPTVFLHLFRGEHGPTAGEEALQFVISALEGGAIVGVRSLGGFQLVCDGLNGRAVQELRARKRRSRKAFAVMVRDLETAGRYCFIDDAERTLLASPAAPIVLLKSRPEFSIAHLAPGLRELGVMLPYTPLHHLLFESSLEFLVMTSGNFRDEPILTSNQDAIEKFCGIADVLLLHNREIFMRVDDSVARNVAGIPRLIRRARGYTPDPIQLPFSSPEVLACGAQMKSTFCLARGRQAILSQHLGDMENLETLDFFEEALRNFEAVYRIEPKAIAHDLHPDYVTSSWAGKQGLPTLAVQHHHAHIASCMIENGLDEAVIGVALDGTGFGTDGQIWGGEFFICDYTHFERKAHLRYVPIVGGSQAVKQPWRMAASHLVDAFGQNWRDLDIPIWAYSKAETWECLAGLYSRSNLMTSSCGRLCDAVSALIGCCAENSYEAEAAMRLEASAGDDGIGSMLQWDLDRSSRPWIIDTRPLIRTIVKAVEHGFGRERIAQDFFMTLAHIVSEICSKIRDETGLRTVCLSGGSFQSAKLLAAALSLLTRAGLRVFSHARVPSNDGGISLGQAAILGRMLGENG
jgi:hydrogenase maturation protein HypF